LLRRLHARRQFILSASLSGNPWDHELYQIRHFAAVVETGSITKAAIRAAVSQPALSGSIAKLEEELGVRLFHRSPKSVTLTPAGRQFHATAQEVLRVCNKVKAELRASVTDRPLRIGILRTLPSAHVARGSLKPCNASCRTHESSLSMEHNKSCMLSSQAESWSDASLQKGRVSRGSVLSSCHWPSR
jgi:hypothetical protein